MMFIIIQFMFIIIQFSLAYCHFLRIKQKISSLTPCFQTHTACVFPLM